MKIAHSAPEGFEPSHELAWIAGIGEWDDFGKIQDVLCQAWFRGGEMVWVPIPRHTPTADDPLITDVTDVKPISTYYAVAAPGIPEGDFGFPDFDPTSELVPGLIRHIVRRLREITKESSMRPLVVPVDEETTSASLGNVRFLVRHLRKSPASYMMDLKP